MPFAHNPALLVELGAVVVLAASLLSRALLNRFGIPSIITLLACGIAVGPSGLGFVHVNLGEPATRALLQLAVVVVLFEATLRLQLNRVSKRAIALLVVVGSALTIAFVPALIHFYHFSHLLASMIAAICIVTGPTVIGPLMARVRPRAAVSRVLETEGLVLDAIGVIVAAVVFASYTSRPGSELQLTWQIVERVGAGIVLGALWGILGRYVLRWTSRASSDLTKVGVLFLGFGAYATADALAHESGLVAVVLCGLLLDFHVLPHERLVRSFKEDLSMLALATVFVLLASQIDVRSLVPLIAPALALVALLIAIRLVAVLIATAEPGWSWAERTFMSTVFPRGIVAVSLATYYATQIPAWGLHGGRQLAGIVFLAVVFSILLSTPLAIVASLMLRLQLPSVAIVGITPLTLDAARRYQHSGHLPMLIDVDAHAVSYARANDLDAVAIEDVREVPNVVRERGAKVVVLDPSWERSLDDALLPESVTRLLAEREAP